MPLEWSSRSIEAAVYDPPQAILEVSFRSGASYRYLDVPPEVYDQFLLAESKGRYFNTYIRNRYAYAKIPAVKWFLFNT